MYTPIMLERIIARLCLEPMDIDSVEGKNKMDIIQDADFIYNNFEQVIIEYQIIQEEGGWPILTQPITLQLGVTASDVAVLAQRLEKTGDLVHPHNGQTFDEVLDASVKLFQERHGLVPDGMVGPATRRALNIGVGLRITQLERAKEIWEDIPREEKKVVVNVPGFRTTGINENNHPEVEIETIVGTVKNKTPTFNDEIEYAMVNPYWNVPYSISSKEILPQIQRAQHHDRLKEYFNEKGYEVFRKHKKLNPTDINWDKYTSEYFPFNIRQKPGSDNMLGEVKFMFPNKYHVYLHDTPYKTLFNNTVRAFSHGCMRLGDWRKMFGFIFPNFPPETLAKIRNTGQETEIRLKNPIPVYVTYMPASVDQYGHVFFYNDVYDKY